MIYLDHNATTPVRLEVVDAMARALRDCHGNPSSVHGAGRKARQAIETARAQVASLVDVALEEIVFVSSGTEGDNQAVRGLAGTAALTRAASSSSSSRGMRRDGRRQIVSSKLEHPAVRECVQQLVDHDGHRATWVEVSPSGEIALHELESQLGDDTGLVTLALANHEIGNVYAMAKVAAAAHQHGAFVHTDAVQAVGRIAVSFRDLGVDAATFSAHKIGGPKGVAAVFIRRGLDLAPLFAGGHQERERHPGTENVAGIVGFGVAAEISARVLACESNRLAGLRAELERQLAMISGTRFHGSQDASQRMPGTTAVAFAGAPGQLIVIGLDLEGICVSTGAACTSGSLRPSPVLRALGLSDAEAAEGVRISLGWTTTEDDIRALMRVLPGIVSRVRAAATEAAASAGARDITEEDGEVRMPASRVSMEGVA